MGEWHYDDIDATDVEFVYRAPNETLDEYSTPCIQVYSNNRDHLNEWVGIPPAAFTFVGPREQLQEMITKLQRCLDGEGTVGTMPMGQPVERLRYM